MKEHFIEALQSNAISKLKNITKSDLHNHAGRGGNISYIAEWAKVKIEPPVRPFDSLNEMQEWFDNNIKKHCHGTQGWLKRIEAAFAQANNDNIKVLALEFGLGDIYALGGMCNFIQIIDDLREHFASKVFDLVSQGFTSFYDGGAIGFDALAAKTVIKARKLFPQVKLNLILPCKDWGKKWKEPDRNEYKEILSKADDIEYVSERYTRDCMFQRNRRLVDSSSVCLCYLNKSKGGTAYTVAYAKNQGVRIINIAEEKEWIR